MSSGGFGEGYGGDYGGAGAGGRTVVSGPVGQAFELNGQLIQRLRGDAINECFASVVTVEFCGRVSVARRPADPMVLLVRRVVTSVFFRYLGGAQMVVHVTTADGVARIPASGLIWLRGIQASAVAVSGYGELSGMVLSAV